MRTTWAVLGLMLVAAPVAAQATGRRSMMDGPKSGEGVLRDITLTADQQARVDSMWKANEPRRNEQMAKMQAMRQGGQRPDSATMAANRAARQAQVREYRNVLTAEQQKVFDKNVAEAMERMGSGGPPR